MANTFLVSLQLLKITGALGGNLYAVDVIDPTDLSVIDTNHAVDINNNPTRVGEYVWASYIGGTCQSTCFRFASTYAPLPCCTVVTLSHTTDAVLFGHGAILSHTTDAVLFGHGAILSHTTDAVLFGHGATLSHTTDVSLLGVTELTHTTDTKTISPSPPPSSDERLPTVADGGLAWSNAENIKADDGSYATLFIAGIPSAELSGSSFGFSVPGGSTIDGIEVKVECHESASAIKLNHVVLSGGFGTSTDLGTTSEIAGSDTEYVFGSPSSLAAWGVTPSVSDVNNTNFTVKIGMQAISGMGPQAFVDYIKVKIYWH